MPAVACNAVLSLPTVTLHGEVQWPFLPEPINPKEAAADEEQATLQAAFHIDMARFMANTAEAQSQPLAATVGQPFASGSRIVAPSVTPPGPLSKDSSWSWNEVRHHHVPPPKHTTQWRDVLLSYSFLDHGTNQISV